MVLLRLAALATCAALVACRPDLSERQSLVTTPRVLAVQSDPPEAEARSNVALSALVVDSTGDAPPDVVDWAICTARKPLAELEPVNPICTSRVGDFLIPLGQGLSAGGKVPSNSCRLFGPEVPSPQPGQPYGRPTDPDTTGGYYLPVRVILAAPTGDEPALGSTRLSCGVTGASSGDATDFRARYHLNTNPKIAALLGNGAPLGKDDATATPLPAGSVVHLEVDWPMCPQGDVCGDGVCGPDETATQCAGDCGDVVLGCGGAERYLAYDTEQQHNVVRHEAMRASWFTTAGSYSVDISGREETDATASATDDLTLPPTPQKVRGWVVLRDSRGGVTWQKFVIDAR